MARKRTVSVKTSIRFTLLIALSSIVVAAAVLHEVLRYYDAERSSRESAHTLAQVLATQLRADVPHSTQDLQLACDRLVEHPAVLAIRLWNQSGDSVAGAAVAEDLLPLLQKPRQHQGRRPNAEIVDLPPNAPIGLPTARRMELSLGAHLRPERPATMVLLLSTAEIQPVLTGRFWLFSLPLLGLGASVFVLGSLRLGRQFVRPISLLVEAVTAERSDRSSPYATLDTPSQSENELETLSQSLSELQNDLHVWRQRAELVERRMDSQIAAQTQRITLDMRRMQREAWRDPLTGVNNRRMLDEKFPELFAAQRDARRDLAVVMLDLDHFKPLNDTLGHAAGDEVLAFAGDLLRQCLRADDVAVRCGGDEFLLILPGMSAQRAMATANRIAALFAQRARFMVSLKPAPTMSAGISSLWNNWPLDHVDLIKQADRALYEAKQAGKGVAKIAKAGCQLSC